MGGCGGYRRREPEASVLYGAVRVGLAEVEAEASERGVCGGQWNGTSRAASFDMVLHT